MKRHTVRVARRDLLRLLGASTACCVLGIRHASSQAANPKRPLYPDIAALGVAIGRLAGSSGPSLAALRLASDNVLERVAAAASDVVSLHTSIYAEYPELLSLVDPVIEGIRIRPRRAGPSTDPIRAYISFLRQLRQVRVAERPAAIAARKNELNQALASVQAATVDFRPDPSLVGFAAALMASEIHLMVLTDAARPDITRAVTKYETWFSSTARQVGDTVNVVRAERLAAHRQLDNTRQRVMCWTDRSTRIEKSRKCTGVRDNRECEDVITTTYNAQVTVQQFRYHASDDLPAGLQQQLAWLTNVGGLRPTDVPRRVSSATDFKESFGTWDNGKDALVNPLLPRESIVSTIQRWLTAVGNQEQCPQSLSDRSVDAAVLEKRLQSTGFSLVALAGVAGGCKTATRACQMFRQELGQTA